MAGSYYVFEYPPGTCDDIGFKPSADAPADIPSEELSFKSEIEECLLVLKSIFSVEDERYKYYFERLLEAARTGLVGERASLSAAHQALETIKKEIATKENEFLKKRYFAKISRPLGLIAASLIIAYGACWASVIYWGLATPTSLPNYILLMLGSLGGLWLSSMIRNKNVSFEQLHFIERDRWPPTQQAFFTCFISLALGILVDVGFVDIVIANLKLSSFKDGPLYALAFGILCGVSENEIDKIVTEKRRIRADQSP